MSEFFQSEAFQNALDILIHQFPLAIWETVYVTILSTFFAVVIGLPLGVLLVAGEHNRILRIPQWILSVLNVIHQPAPLHPLPDPDDPRLPAHAPHRRHRCRYARNCRAARDRVVPFIARLVESSLRELNPNIIETAQSMGASPMQIVCRVMLPESVPSLISNATIAVTTVLGYSAMSGIIGGGGLGKIAINYGYYRYQYIVMAFAVIFLILLVQIFQSVGTKLVAKCDKRLK